jgi:hypothetical protein
MVNLKTYFRQEACPLARLFVALACALLPFTTGCASSGKYSMRQPLSVKLALFKSAIIEVKSSLPKNPEKLDEFKVQLESRIIAKLRERKAFEKIYPAAANDQPSELHILVIITAVRDIDNYTRVMWGAFAGQANTQVTVELREKASGKLLGSAEIEGKSSGGSVFAGTTTEAVDRVADQVIQLVTENL